MHHTPSLNECPRTCWKSSLPMKPSKSQLFSKCSPRRLSPFRTATRAADTGGRFAVGAVGKARAPSEVAWTTFMLESTLLEALRRGRFSPTTAGRRLSSKTRSRFAWSGPVRRSRCRWPLLLWESGGGPYSAMRTCTVAERFAFAREPGWSPPAGAARATAARRADSPLRLPVAQKAPRGGSLTTRGSP